MQTTAAPDSAPSLPAFLSFTVHSNEMISQDRDAIFSNDVILVDTQKEASDKDLVLFESDSEIKVRQLQIVDKNKYLIAFNHSYPPILLTPNQTVIGVVIEKRHQFNLSS